MINSIIIDSKDNLLCVSGRSDSTEDGWAGVLGFGALWACHQAGIHHGSIIIEPEESPNSDVVAAHKLADLEVIDCEVPQPVDEEFTLNSVTDYHLI